MGSYKDLVRPNNRKQLCFVFVVIVWYNRSRINGSCQITKDRAQASLEIKVAQTVRRIMTVIDEIEAKLKGHPEIRYEVGQNRICVPAASDQGFPVEMVVSRGTFTVSFSGWHEEFSDKDDAMNCFAFGLSRDCRLKVSRYGRFEYKWTLESSENGVWVEDSATGLLMFPLCRTNYLYLQNDLISSSRATEE